MSRRFNIAGPCVPSKHYMLPPERRLPGVRELIDDEYYFVIQAPRQVGKTTCFRSLAAALTEEGHYTALHASCERGQAVGSDVATGVQLVCEAITSSAEIHLSEELRPPAIDTSMSGGSRLNDLLQRWSQASPRPVVLFLDEIDALYDDLLISVLRQLRDGYPNRPDAFPHALALIGLRDVRDYKVRDGHTPRLGTASPFNIKVESLTLRNFTADEVTELLEQHTTETGQGFEAAALELVWELTRGQPWLVNALARQLVEREVPDRSTPITRADVERAREAIIERRDTHLDSLIDRLREPRVQRIIEPILAGNLVLGDRLDDDIAFAEDLGLVERRNGGHLRIANPIYAEVIPRALANATQATIPYETAWYVRDDGSLDMRGLLEAFVGFWRQHGPELLAAQPYHEAAPHLVLMAFLQRIVNGGGFIDREYGIGRGRIDLLVRWPFDDDVQREALELKVWRPGQTDPLSSGLTQLWDYLDGLGLDAGVLVIFDRRPEAPAWSERGVFEAREERGKRIVVLRL